MVKDRGVYTKDWSQKKIRQFIFWCGSRYISKSSLLHKSFQCFISQNQFYDNYFAETANAFGLFASAALEEDVSKLSNCLKEAKSDWMGVAFLRIMNANSNGIDPFISIC